MTEQPKDRYYEMDCLHSDMMMLYSVILPFGEGLYLGRLFKKEPKQPMVVGIQPGENGGVLLPFFSTQSMMSEEFYQTMLEAGVDNLDAYDIEIHGEKGAVVIKGYKLVNIVGLISAADLSQTSFASDNPSRILDASIEELVIDPKKARGALCFRLAESSSTVIVHEKVKRAIEAKNFIGMKFYELTLSKR